MVTAPTPGTTRAPLPRMKPIIFDWDDRRWEYDPQRIDVRTATAIKLHTGLGLRSWSKACDDWDPAAVQALLWAVRQQNGEIGSIAELNFSVGDFMGTFTTAMLEATAAWVAEVNAHGDDEDPSDAGPSILEQMSTSAT